MINRKTTIVHKLIRQNYGSSYLCNQAVKSTPKKSSYRWDKVTCKNCLKQKPVKCDICKKTARYDEEKHQYYCNKCQWWICV